MRASSQPSFNHILTLLTHSHSLCHIWPQLLPHLLTLMFQVPHITTIHYSFGNIKVCLLLPSHSLIPQLPRISIEYPWQLLIFVFQIPHIITSFISIYTLWKLFYFEHILQSCGGVRTKGMCWESCHEDRVVAWWKGAGATLQSSGPLLYTKKSRELNIHSLLYTIFTLYGPFWNASTI